MKKEATAYLLEEETIPVIAKQADIEEKVLQEWLAHDRAFGLHTKVIVVMVTKEEET